MQENNPLILKLERSGLLSPDDRQTLAALCTEPRSVPVNTVLVRQWEPLGGVYVVLSGFAHRYKLLEGGRRQIIGVLVPGDFCDLQAALLREVDHFTATLTNCSVVWLPRETVDDLTLARSRIARALWWCTLVDESILRTWLTNMGQQPADQWLAHLLSELLLRLQVAGRTDAGGCELPLTQEQIADILGVSNVHVSRVLKELRGRDLVHLKGKRLSVPNLPQLHAFCGFDARYLHLKASEDVEIR